MNFKLIKLYPGTMCKLGDIAVYNKNTSGYYIQNNSDNLHLPTSHVENWAEFWERID